MYSLRSSLDVLLLAVGLGIWLRIITMYRHRLVSEGLRSLLLVLVRLHVRISHHRRHIGRSDVGSFIFSAAAFAGGQQSAGGPMKV